MAAIFTNRAAEEISKTVRDSKANRAGDRREQERPRGGSHGIFVKVTGAIVAMTTTATSSTSTTTTTTAATTTTTTSGTGTTTTTTPCIGNSTTSSTGTTTTTTVGQKYVYPGKFVYRNIDSLTNEEWWYEGDEDIWVQEINNQGLGLGCRYPGNVAGEYRGLVIIGVRNFGDANSCTSTTTSTTCGCLGYCNWTLEGETWTLTENHCDSMQGCDCVPPDFCPPDFGCGNTITQCSHNVDPNTPLIVCPPEPTTTTTGTGTTSSTTITTTTTPDPLSCGPGCVWKNIPVSGLGIIVIEGGCNVGLVLPSGFICTGCVPPGLLDPCDTVVTPCGSVGPPPPLPGCEGSCEWVWPDVDGMWWILVSGTCFTGQSAPCFCDSPSVAGSFCNQRVTTSCHEPRPTTTSGTGTGTTSSTSGSSTTQSSTTTLGGCRDFCIWRWDAQDPGGWIVITNCGSSCDCSEPLFVGTGPCDIVRTPCITTTTTSSTTTTTTTTACTVANCVWTCTQDDFLYYWVLTTPCNEACECPPPIDICGPWGGGGEIPGTAGADDERIIPCFPTTSSTSTTTTTTVFPPEECNCPSQSPPGTCCWCCAFVSIPPLPPGYRWVICGIPQCPPGGQCQNPGLVGAPCSSLNAGQVSCTNCGLSTATSTSGTFTTATGTGAASFTTAWERPTTSTTTTTTTTTLPGGNITSGFNNGSDGVTIRSENDHGLSTGAFVEIAGTTEYDGQWFITVLSVSDFDLDGATYTTDVGSGTWQQLS